MRQTLLCARSRMAPATMALFKMRKGLEVKFAALFCAASLLLWAVPMDAAGGFNLGVPGLDDGPQLVTLGNEPAVRYPVAHQHAASGCGGYLYFSATTIRFEVLHPDKDKIHAFQYPRADLVVAQVWRFMGTTMPEAELKFKDGRVFHFFRVRRKVAENESEKMTWDNVLPQDALIEAATNFAAAMAQAKANQEMLAGITTKAAPAAAPAAAAAPPAPAPPDDSAALGAAGLDVAPPAPWLRTAVPNAGAAGSAGGRP